MKHLGDITKIDGSKIDPVDIITFGSPCQDLSVAGKREGLAGERSGLFMEAVRIIKEMRNATKQLSMRGADKPVRVCPRIAIWENVPGAYSSNNGEDFRCVLEELARIENPEVSIPRSKKWLPNGVIELPKGCISWRTHDAQYWGVPQRRRRISLVVDFRDEPRPEIQFIPESLSRNLEQSKEEGEETSRTFGESSDISISFQERGGKPGGGKGILIQKDHVGALSTLNNQAVLNSSGGDVSGTIDASYYKGCGERQGVEREVLCVGNGQTAQSYLQDRTGALNCMHDQQAVITFSDTHNALNADDGPKGVHSQMMNAPESNFVVSYGISSYDSNAMKSSNPNSGIYEAETSRTLDNNGGNPACNQGIIVLEGNGSRPSHKGDGFSEADVSYTLNAVEQHGVCYEEPLLLESNQNNATVQVDKSTALPASMGMGGGYVPMVCYGLDRASFNQGQNAKYDISIQEDIAQPLVARGPGGG